MNALQTAGKFMYQWQQKTFTSGNVGYHGGAVSQHALQKASGVGDYMLILLASISCWILLQCAAMIRTHGCQADVQTSGAKMS